MMAALVVAMAPVVTQVAPVVVDMIGGGVAREHRGSVFTVV